MNKYASSYLSPEPLSRPRLTFSDCGPVERRLVISRSVWSFIAGVVIGLIIDTVCVLAWLHL